VTRVSLQPRVAEGSPRTGPPGSVGRTVSALCATAVTLALVGVVLLLPYVVHHFTYPLGWDAPLYIWRADAVRLDGLARIGAIRAGTPLLFGILVPATGQSAFTLAAVVPAVLAGVAALGSAAMLRAALRIGTWWVPVVGFLSWAAFVKNEIPLHHTDNLLNAAFVLPALASALAVVASRKGTIAVTVLFMAAGLAHWPFLAFALVAYMGAVLAFAYLSPERTGRGLTALRGLPARLMTPVVVSAGFTALTFLAVPESGWLGAQPGLLRRILRVRMLRRLSQVYRYLPVPLAAVGFACAAVADLPSGVRPARRLFLWMMTTWLALTIVGVAIQLAGIPSAGARLLSYLFPVTILAGAAVWWAARWLGRHLRGLIGLGAAAALVGIVAGAFVGLGWALSENRRPWFEREAVAQIATAGAYVQRHAEDRRVVYLLSMEDPKDRLTLGRWWLTVKASIPAQQVARAEWYIGTPAAFERGLPSELLGDGLPPGESDRPYGKTGETPVAVVVRRYNTQGFDEAAARSPERVVAPGVFVLDGPLPAEPIPPAEPPVARTDAWSLAWVSFAIVVLLFAAGSGWSVALLPPDPVLRAAVAPALGAAVLILGALPWTVLGRPLTGPAALSLVAVVVILGWAANVRFGRGVRG